MAPPRLRLRTSNYSLLLIYLPRKDERLTYSGRFTHINGHSSAGGRAQDRESSLVKDQRSTTVPRNQPTNERTSVYMIVGVLCVLQRTSDVRYAADKRRRCHDGHNVETDVLSSAGHVPDSNDEQRRPPRPADSLEHQSSTSSSRQDLR